MSKCFCSDCAYFEFNELIDKHYPILKRGYCNYLNKEVDNRWEIDCDYNLAKTYNCMDCVYCSDNINYISDEDDNELKENYPYVCRIL